MKDAVTVYNAGSCVTDSLTDAWRQTCTELWANRWRIWVDFKSVFRARYASARLGSLWNLILPLVPASVAHEM